MVNNFDSFGADVSVDDAASHIIVHIFRIIILRDRKVSLIAHAFLHRRHCDRITSLHLKMLLHHYCIVQYRYELFETFSKISVEMN